MKFIYNFIKEHKTCMLSMSEYNTIIYRCNSINKMINIANSLLTSLFITTPLFNVK